MVRSNLHTNLWCEASDDSARHARVKEAILDEFGILNVQIVFTVPEPIKISSRGVAYKGDDDI